jgi:hypothetical protein
MKDACVYTPSWVELRVCTVARRRFRAGGQVPAGFLESRWGRAHPERSRSLTTAYCPRKGSTKSATGPHVRK